MGSMTFDRNVASGAPEQRISFDSEPKRSLCLQYGWDQTTFFLQQTEATTPELNVYDVYAASTTDGRPQKQGVLRAKTRAAIWAAQG